MKKRNAKVVALVVTLFIILVALPASISLGIGVSYMRWKADHPATTVVPDVTGRDRQSAEAAIKNAQLVPQIAFAPINDRCWQEPRVPNTVIDQDPKPYEVVSVETGVRVFVGKNESNALALSVKANCCTSP